MMVQQFHCSDNGKYWHFYYHMVFYSKPSKAPVLDTGCIAHF